MKKWLLSSVLLLFFLLTHLNAKAQTVYDWFGATNVWTLNTNWRVNGLTPATAPGSTDIIRIGTNQTFTVSPKITGTITCASIALGISNPITLTVDGTLNVTGTITQYPNTVLGDVTTNITGAGTINCANLQAGDSQAFLSVTLGGGNQTTVISTVANLNVSANVTVNSTSYSALFIGLGLNNVTLSLRGGTTTVGGTILTLNTKGGLIPLAVAVPKFSLDMPTGTTTSPTLKLTNAAPVNTASLDGSIDFYNNTGGTGVATVEYAGGTSQTVYSNVLINLNHTPTTYQNLTFSAAATKISRTGDLLVTGDLTINGTATTPVIDLASNSATAYVSGNLLLSGGTLSQGSGFITVAGSLLGTGGTLSQGSGNITVNGTTLQNTGGTFTLGTGTLTFNGTTFTNTGTFTPGAGKITFGNNGATTLTTTTPITFNTVEFTDGNTKTLTSGSFLVSSSGLITVSNSTTLAAGGNLTLVSDASNSASLDKVTGTSAITGNVNVQRFVKGSSTGLSKRGYRLISSPVYTGTVTSPTTSKVFDLSYILNDAFVTGASGGGFNSAANNNASLYLYREDIVPNNTGLTAGNYKGIAKMNNTTIYDIGTQKRTTTANIVDTTVNIPVGNGVLFFFRGNKTDNATQTGTKVTLPYDYPEDVVFTQVGQLNTGTINVRLWYKTNFDLGYSVINSPSPGNSSVRGYCLVGNPYASTINWEKFNRNSTRANSSIYGAGFQNPPDSLSTIWMFNPTTKQYDSYMQKAGTVSTTDTSTTVNPGIKTGSASNMIASGQGFFIRARGTNRTLSFRETAKTTTPATASALNQLMSIPGDNAIAESLNPLLRFQMIKDSINTDEIVLTFSKNATTMFSTGEDAEDLGGNGAQVSLSSLSADSVKLAINRLPLPNASQTEVPILISATTTGIYQLKLNEMKDLPGYYEVWLKDKFTSDSLDIRHHNTYTFNLYRDNAASFASDRFRIVIRQNAILAAQAMEFHAIKAGSVTQITWKPVNGITYANFHIERSTDDKNYTAIASLPPNSSNNYLFTDNTPAKGVNYYRLRLESIDNQSAWSKQEMVYYQDIINNIASSNNMVLYPNPVVDKVNMVLKSDNTTAKNYTINVMNASGTIIKTATSSQPEWQYNAGDLVPGTYIIQAVDTNTKKVAGVNKFIKK